MITRHHGFELGVALSFASACLTTALPALAEDTAPPAATDAPADPTPPAEEAPPAAPPEASAEPAPEPPPAEAPAEEEASTSGVSASAEVSLPVPSEAEESETTVSTDTAERDKTVAFVGLETLPGSAFPSEPVRGIKYGSLWRTLHGQQGPYLPMIDGKPGLRVGLSGYFWNDLSNSRISVDKTLADGGTADQDRWTTQTRGVLRAQPTYSAEDGWFAQGTGEFVIQGDMSLDTETGVLPTTDDVWVRVGKWHLFDVTAGRFQGWEIANHYGMALDQNTLERSGAWIVTSNLPKPSDGYGLSWFWDRQNKLLGAYAVHLYPTEYLRAELLGHIGAGKGNAGNPKQMDFRPSVIFDIGWMKLKAGWEYGSAVPQDSKKKGLDARNGFGGAAQFVFDPYVEFGGSFARGFQDVQDKDAQVDLISSNTVQTMGGFVNVSPMHEPLVIGFGAFFNQYANMRYDTAPGPHHDKVDTNEQLLLFGAAQYTLWDHLNLKLVVSHATNDVSDYKAGIYTNESLSARVRMEVLF